MRIIHLLRLASLFSLLLVLAATARADSVAQVGTSVRISRDTAILLDPQGRPGVVGMGTDTAAMPGDVLSFLVHFTPVPNGAVRGLGGYITVYVPRNTEVVGARFVDLTGATVRPHRGGLAADGVGPRGTTGYIAPLVEGSLSQLYADTGIFYSTDPRTERVPNGMMPADQFLSLFNGLAMTPAPTAYGQLRPILGAGATGYAHNQWDLIQVFGFGVGGGAINDRGSGNTPDLYGSAVAGPDSWYGLEASYMGDLTMPLLVSNVRASGTRGPWLRVQTWGGEIGRRGVMPPVPDPGLATRIGIPALDGAGNPLGVQLDGGHPLPSFDPAMPARAHTRAVRYAVGELVVGEEYVVEISLRVLRTPLDPISMSDVVCAEVFGGDASAEEADGTSKGKDNPWRYFLPAPACVSLPLLFDFDVSRLTALPGETLDYTIHGKNLATRAETNVVVRQCFTAGDLTFVSATMGGVRGAGAGCPDPGAQDDVTWTLGTLDPGEEYTLRTQFTVGGGGRITISRATYTSDQLPAPGFSVLAATDIRALTIIDLAMIATPGVVPAAPARVRYRATIGNRGTGVANVTGCGSAACGLYVTLPAGFTYVAGSTTVGGAAAGNPAVTGRVALFTSGLTNIPPGGSLVIEFDVDIPAGTAAGAYTSDMETWLDDPGGGMAVNDARAGVGEVIVGTVRSDVPVVRSPIFEGATTVAGTTTEAAGTTIRVQLRGVNTAMTTSDAAGAWSATVPRLFAGERVTATAQAAGELESLRSAEVVVAAVGSGGPAACGDGIDNDGDGLIDGLDPDCESAADLDEAHVPECANAADDDGDGTIDFGADEGCSSLADDTEAGGADCGNGMDDDGDGSVDFPMDPGCSDAMDVSERDIPACANGVDDDMDGAADYPLDPGCENALDGDESAVPGIDAGVADGGTAGGDAGPGGDAGAAADAGGPPDPGGVDEPGGGCGCTTPAGSPVAHWPIALIAILLVWRRRRRS